MKTAASEEAIEYYKRMVPFRANSKNLRARLKFSNRMFTQATAGGYEYTLSPISTFTKKPTSERRSTRRPNTNDVSLLLKIRPT